VFKTKDGHINIATTGQRIWQRFCETAGATALMRNRNTRPPRRVRRTAMRSPPRSTTISRAAPAPNGSRRFNKAGVPCGPIYAIDQMFADPQVQHLGMAQSVTKKDKSKMRLVAQPVTLSRTPSRLAARPPELGEHTDAVLKEFGFSRARHRGAAQGQRRLNLMNCRDARVKPAHDVVRRTRSTK
jgi:crotonobetainyl-CoA:carnitine CoA-transferase CaiB-like acyl-CoA transferase